MLTLSGHVSESCRVTLAIELIQGRRWCPVPRGRGRPSNPSDTVITGHPNDGHDKRR